MMTKSSGISWVLAATVLLTTGAALAADVDLTRGERLYKVCAGCHGFAGEGNELVNAPALAGLDSWYIARQIYNYQKAIRGGVKDDIHGRNMAAMVAGLTELQTPDVVGYIASLPLPGPAQDVGGNVDKGRTLYAPCAACHGDRAQGIEAMGGPSLVHLAPWYQIAQLEKFRSGQRGVHPEDHFGRQMAPMAKVLADAAALADVSAYIASLKTAAD